MSLLHVFWIDLKSKYHEDINIIEKQNITLIIFKYQQSPEPKKMFILGSESKKGPHLTHLRSLFLILDPSKAPT